MRRNGGSLEFSGPTISLFSEYDQDFLAALMCFNPLILQYSVRLERLLDFISNADSLLIGRGCLRYWFEKIMMSWYLGSVKKKVASRWEKEKRRCTILLSDVYYMCMYCIVKITVYAILILRGHNKGEIAHCRQQILAMSFINLLLFLLSEQLNYHLSFPWS